MKSFLLINLAAEPAYEQPLLRWVRQSFPEVATFDVDVHSSEELQHYAVRFLREASEVVICIKAGEGPLLQLMPLLEELLQGGADKSILLLGQHSRLERMLAARPAVKYKVVKGEQGFKEEVRLFFAR
ncbi:hypothetical protein [Pontibacter ruber]|uniref:Uncharacterized protein n=1 Tax=Pontibacter ruber TaxID=1343895 RepID=A0ABW5CYL0_9BACT|nr:hypothetical protein [Pontibacter ruber]